MILKFCLTENKLCNRRQWSNKIKEEYEPLFTLFIISVILQYKSDILEATSINYGISQQPITDMNQLMPKLCQNQSVICEGSFCIPGVKKCVCDLRMPVQFNRYCLRQVDIETKCFVTNQCNHTIKDAVCIDINSNSILNAESSKFKLDQWQQLQDLRQKKVVSKMRDMSEASEPTRFSTQDSTELGETVKNDSNKIRRYRDISSNNDIFVSNLRNSPYEINYNTPELLLQNHTRRRTNDSKSNKSNSPLIIAPTTASTTTISTTSIAPTTSPAGRLNQKSETSVDGDNSETDRTTTSYSSNQIDSSSKTSSETSTISSTQDSTIVATSDSVSTISTKIQTSSAQTAVESQNLATTTVSPNGEHVGRKKMIIKSPSWPPGICSCPFGYMFDSMLRKCLTISLADSHCQSDHDCRQIPMTHCNLESKKCQCEEPLVWSSKDSSCQRQPAIYSDDNLSNENSKNIKLGVGNGNFVDYILTSLIIAKLFPAYVLILLLFIICIIVLVMFKLMSKWFSSGSSTALISPTKCKKKTKSSNSNNNNIPKSPYATLRRPSHKPLSNITQATRGRILNYDFEQEEELKKDIASDGHSPQQHSFGTVPRNQSKSKTNNDRANLAGTLKLSMGNKGHKHNHDVVSSSKKSSSEQSEDQLLELNDNISIGQVDQSDSSILTIPGPPATQQPPYMLTATAYTMKGQGSTIAAAAAAVANKRIQMAQQKKMQDQQQASSKVANGSPVFL